MTQSVKELIEVAVGNGERVDVVDLTREVLLERNIGCRRTADDLEVADVGLTLSPRVLQVAPMSAGVRTVSIIRARHAQAFPQSLVEFQHGGGGDIREALLYGLNGWLQLDYPVLAMRRAGNRSTARSSPGTSPPATDDHR